MVILTVGNTATGSTLPADGRLLPISQNQALFSLFGTKYGGDGKTTFRIPNLKKAAPNGLSYSICQFGIFP
jgi:microcystin-dependent protein